MRLRERFEQLTPAGRKTVIWSVLGVLLITLTLTGYHARSGRKHDQADSAGRDLRLEEDLMEKTIFREHRRKLEDLEGLVTTMQRELDRVAKEKAAADKCLSINSHDLVQDNHSGRQCVECNVREIRLLVSWYQFAKSVEP